jgi:hypothetical protein
VTDFKVKDILPEALDYLDFVVTLNIDNLVVSEPGSPVKS